MWTTQEEEETGGRSREYDVLFFSVINGREIGWWRLRRADKWHASDGEETHRCAAYGNWRRRPCGERKHRRNDTKVNLRRRIMGRQN